MDALAAGHDAAVQMIDTSVVRVHQHSACVATTSTRSSDAGAARPDMTSSRPTIWPSSSLHPFAFGCVLMTPRLVARCKRRM
jgi:hypothetical protein